MAGDAPKPNRPKNAAATTTPAPAPPEAAPAPYDPYPDLDGKEYGVNYQKYPKEAAKFDLAIATAKGVCFTALAQAKSDHTNATEDAKKACPPSTDDKASRTYNAQRYIALAQQQESNYTGLKTYHADVETAIKAET